MFTVSQNGKELDKSKYSWDEKSKTFGTNEDNLVLDFSEHNGVAFNTGSDCTFNTGSDCTFKTGWNCTFNTGSDCTFNTGDSCTFNVGEKCCLHYTWNDCFEVYKLVPDKLVKILENGKLEDVKNVVPVVPKQKVTLELTEEQLEQVKKMIG